ncbi:hypothetical protein PoB_006751600, partial [Plakobranchus ocellatus]
MISGFSGPSLGQGNGKAKTRIKEVAAYLRAGSGSIRLSDPRPARVPMTELELEGPFRSQDEFTLHCATDALCLKFAKGLR